MALFSRLFKRGRGDPLAERERELKQARRQGERDAREHPLGEFTDAEAQPAYVSQARAWAKEQIAQIDQRLAETRAELVRAAGASRETILRETTRTDLVPHLPWNGQASASGGDAVPDQAAPQEDGFISIAEARRRRAERECRSKVLAAGDAVQRARSRIEQLAQEWDSALVGRNHAVDAIHARAAQRIAAYRTGIMREHPRKEEIAPLWKGEVVAMDSTMDSPTAVAGREALGRLLSDADQRIEVWRAQQIERPSRRELPGAEESRLIRPGDYEHQGGQGLGNGWAAGVRDGGE